MTPTGARPILALVAFWLGVLGLAVQAHGHALEPGYLELRRVAEDRYAVVWKVPAVGSRAMAITARLPERCNPRLPGQQIWNGSAYVSRWTAHCPGGLEGGRIVIDGLDRTATDVLVRYDFADGTDQAHRLTADDIAFTVPAQPSAMEVIRTYFLFGVEHILGGIDHLMFVLALLLLVEGWRRIVATVTAFTVAHSITLAGAALGLVDMPGPPVEAAIALSIVFVAAEIVQRRRGREGLTARNPWLVAFAFGLLHGFGFAGALTEVGLPEGSIPTALLFFNLGVEAGQLIFVFAMLSFVALARRLPRRLVRWRPGWVWAIPPYAIGGCAAFWFVERIAAF